MIAKFENTLEGHCKLDRPKELSSDGQKCMIKGQPIWVHICDGLVRELIDYLAGSVGQNGTGWAQANRHSFAGAMT